MKTLQILILLFFTAQWAFSQPTEAWVRSEIEKIVSKPDADLSNKKILEKIDEVMLQQVFIDDENEDTYIAYCTPDSDQLTGFLAGLPLYLYLLIEKKDNNWEMTWYKQWYELDEIDDKTGDGLDDLVGSSMTCKRGKCYFQYELIELRRQNKPVILTIKGFDFSGADYSNYSMGDTITYLPNISFVQLGNQIKTAAMVEYEVGVINEVDEVEIEFELSAYELSWPYYELKQTTHYPLSLRNFADQFEAAIFKKDAKEVLSFFDPAYVEEQHDGFLEGRTSQFFSEFFCSEPAYQKKPICTNLQDILKVERQFIAGFEPGEYVIAYKINSKAGEFGVMLSVKVLQGKKRAFGFYGGVG